MRLHLLLPYSWDTAPSQRYRIEQWTPWLRSRGATITTSTLLDARQQNLLYSPGRTAGKASVLLRGMARRLFEVQSLSGCDAVWLHRAAWPIGPPLPERVLARRRIPIIFEFDDAIFLNHTSAANQRWKSLKWAGKTGEICRLSASVVTGNDYLADYARQFNPSVSVIPTSVDTDAYQTRKSYRASGPVTIGWSGSGTTLAHLRTLEPVLKSVASAAPVRLHVVGVPGYDLPGVPTTAVEWRPERQVQELQRMDIGVMPLPDEEWARGKCACKALEYMAVGVPTVTAPVGVNARIIRHGQNGMLAGTEEEWRQHLLALVSDESMRARLGVAGRETVDSSYSTRVIAPIAHELLRRVVAPQAAVSHT